MPLKRWIVLLTLAMLVVGCDDLIVTTDSGFNTGSGSAPVNGEQARVVRVVDGDTIDVEMNGQRYSVRYIGVNTPERDEACFSDATRANRALVENQTVTLVKDVSDTDRFDRLLRYVYVGETFVNETLVRDGWAEAVRYDPDTAYFQAFVTLEQNARLASNGCHPTGIFDDGSATR